MADNVEFTAGVGTTGAADDIGGVYYPRVKLSLGADGSAVDAIAGAGVAGTGVQRVTVATDDALHTKLGEVQASPTANTVLDRLKALLTGTILAAGTAVIGYVNLITGQTGITGGAGAVGASTPRVTLASDDPGVSKLTSIAKSVEGDYETVAASQTAQVLGSTGAIGDHIAGILVIPATTAPGAISILDNATSITVFVGGTIGDVVPFVIPLGMYSVSGAWKVTTGANVSCIAIGSFT